VSKKCKSHKNTHGKKQQKAKKKLVAHSQFILILTCDHSGPGNLQSPNDTQPAPRIRIRHCAHGTNCLFGLQTRRTKCHTIVFLPRALASEVINSAESVHPFVSILQFLNQLTCEFDFLLAYASRPRETKVRRKL